MVSTKEDLEKEKWMEMDNLSGKIKRNLRDTLKMGISMGWDKYHFQMVRKRKEYG